MSYHQYPCEYHEKMGEGNQSAICEQCRREREKAERGLTFLWELVIGFLFMLALFIMFLMLAGNYTLKEALQSILQG